MPDAKIRGDYNRSGFVPLIFLFKGSYYLITIFTISGKLNSRSGNELFPSPLLIISVVWFLVCAPDVYFGKIPWFGA